LKKKAGSINVSFMSLKEDALNYHSMGKKGKIEVNPSKPVSTQYDLSLAYSPGVAEPCLVIAQDEKRVFDFTAKGNLVAVISNGSAVLGLGNIGPLAAKPVMEGKGVLFKKFADIDVFDIELNTQDPDEIIQVCTLLEPTFGGINLEDIKAPECFYIEEKLKEKLKIPVFHDDQHGTAVISAAAFLNALEVTNKKIEDVKVVFCGSGAAAIACAKLYLHLGIKKENLFMVDSKGILTLDRLAELNDYKKLFARDTQKKTIAEALDGADAFVGVSVKGAITGEMIKKMNPNPIIFAMANPDPEIDPEIVAQVRPDAIMATGRSDYPNQVNNVLGFPSLFRGALDTRSLQINEEMKLAAVYALAHLAKQEVPESVRRAYGGQHFQFGKDYLIPKPFDQRVLLWVSPAVAKAAMQSGVAQKNLDLKEYQESLESLLGKSHALMRGIKNRAKGQNKPKIVFPEGSDTKILQAVQIVIEEGIAEPILLGNPEIIKQKMQELQLSSLESKVRVFDPQTDPDAEKYALQLFEERKRKGITLVLAKQHMKNPSYFASMMVKNGLAEAMISGRNQSYPEALRPAIQVIGTKKGSLLSGVFVVIIKKRIFLLADTTVNIDPSSADLCEIALETAAFAHRFLNEKPRLALLSFSNFGSNHHAFAQKMALATKMIHMRAPELIVDGEMQADVAVSSPPSASHFPFNQVPGDANVLIFPNLESGNIAYKLLTKLGAAESIGPILIGMKHPVFILDQNAEVNDIVNMTAIASNEIFGTKRS
jgi:malate dehydrogenase (oxaloacetate-decarboxylating)(NADP+)